MSKKFFPMFKHVDPFTGAEFESRHEHHYEPVDPTPFAPALDHNRPTIRQRIENLLNRGVDPLSHYVGTEGIDFEVPDDPEAPLTASEMNYIDAMAESLAEQAPGPDDGLPRPDVPAPPRAPEPDPAGVSSPPQAPPPATGAKPVPT